MSVLEATVIDTYLYKSCVNKILTQRNYVKVKCLPPILYEVLYNTSLEQNTQSNIVKSRSNN